MAPRNHLNRDISERESYALNRVLNNEIRATQGDEGLISVEEALREKRMFSSGAKRSTLRVLFISQDTTLLNPTTQSLDGYLQLRDLFEEVHILILRTGIPAKYPVLRVDKNVWMYTATAKYWWRLPGAGVELLEQELVFANGFRPDLIVARDPFESGLVGRSLAKKYNKPLQVHVLKNYTGEDWRHEAGKNLWRRFLPRYTIAAATSVRADTTEIEKVIKERFSVPDLSLLPKYHSYDRIINTKPTINIKEKYQAFSFLFLYIGKLHANSTVYQVIDACRGVLQNPRVGLLILGDGSAKTEFKKRAKILGVEKQVVFESKVTDIVSYLKGADVAVVTDTDDYADEVVLQAAAAGLPIIMTTTEKRQDLFEDKVSALLCPAGDSVVLTESIQYMLNNAGQRKLMGEYAQDVVKRRFHNSERMYRDAFRNSIEETIFVDTEENSETESES